MYLNSFVAMVLRLGPGPERNRVFEHSSILYPRVDLGYMVVPLIPSSPHRAVLVNRPMTYIIGRHACVAW